MWEIKVSRCRIQCLYVESVCDYGFKRRTYKLLTKKEDTWRKILLHLRCRIRFNPEIVLNFKGWWHRRYFAQSQLGWQLVCPLPQLEWQALELELQLARQQLQLQQSCRLLAILFISLSFFERVLFYQLS